MASSCSTTILLRAQFSHRIVASNSRQPPRRINGSLPRKQPSIADVQRAVGITDDPPSVNTSKSNSSFLDVISPSQSAFGETSIEKTIRLFAERFAEQTEANSRSAQQILLVVCVQILPVWIFLLLVASGVLKLPFDLPFLEELIS